MFCEGVIQRWYAKGQHVGALATCHGVHPRTPGPDKDLPKMAAFLVLDTHPAYAIESVAEPAPAFAFTTSSPPNWMRTVRASRSASLNLALGTWHWSGKGCACVWGFLLCPCCTRERNGDIVMQTIHHILVTCERSGNIVMPAWPPMTVTLTSVGDMPWFSATKVLARQTSSVVTPQTWMPWGGPWVEGAHRHTRL